MSDLISREAAIEAIESHLRVGDEVYPLTRTDKILNHAFEIAASCVYNLPNAEVTLCHLDSPCEYQNADIAMPSAERAGKWIEASSGDHWKCSRCNCRAGFWFNEENSCGWSMDMSEWLSDFCPNCGARMKGADDDN